MTTQNPDHMILSMVVNLIAKPSPPTHMVSKEKIECWIYGDDVDELFLINISTIRTVASLKEAIKDKAFVTLHDTEAHKLDLYDIPSPDDEHIRQELEQWTPQGKHPLNSRTEVSQIKERLIIVNAPTLTLTLNCWVRGDKVGRIFTVKVPGTETVASLKGAIKNEKPVDFGDIDANALDLYQVCFPFNDSLGQTLKEFVPCHDAWMGPVDVLSDILRKVPPPRHVHVVVKPPHVSIGRRQARQSESDDMLAPLIESFIRTTTITPESLTPSQAANPSEYAKFQSSDRRILDGRSSAANPINTLAPPIRLFHPAFAYFSSKAFDPQYDVPNTVIRDIRDLMVQFTLIDTTKEARQDLLRSFLSTAISDETVPDFIAESSYRESPTYLIIGGEKNKFDDGASDPSTQATFSFIRIVSQSKSRLKCCCPAFIIAYAGPWLTIMGGIVTSHCVVQRLTDLLWIPVRSTHDDGQFHRIARILYVLRQSIKKLDSWYKSLDEVPAFNPARCDPHPRFFPSPCAYLDGATLVKFVYQKPLERDVSCLRYHAKTIQDNPKDVVVKFVTSYGIDAHQEMASAGYAPKILYYGQIDVTPDMPSYGGLHLVVMEYVSGWTLESALKQNKIPGSFGSDLRNVLKQLHDSGYVHGDLRSPNIMITLEGKPRLVNFDWAGKKGEAQYPLSISRSVDWPAGVQGLALIKEEHDYAMLDTLTSQFFL